ncbi:hypothetical protein GW17_00057116 [Ensete ventricosum]|nr:hypothetical protein GW17_00057116 [Ensete ventricosum]RZS29282.1 hypothetical protein BHM03_00062995 [Ensete ventricosum]
MPGERDAGVRKPVGVPLFVILGVGYILPREIVVLGYSMGVALCCTILHRTTLMLALGAAPDDSRAVEALAMMRSCFNGDSTVAVDRLVDGNTIMFPPSTNFMFLCRVNVLMMSAVGVVAPW